MQEIQGKYTWAKIFANKIFDFIFRWGLSAQYNDYLYY